MIHFVRPAVRTDVGRRCLIAGSLVCLVLAGLLVPAPAAGATAPAEPPTGVSAVEGDASALVSWIPPAEDPADPIQRYLVATSGASSIPVVEVSAPGTSVTVSGLRNGSAYTFTVVAQAAGGDSPASAPSNSVTPRTVPEAPRGVSADPGDGAATVTWTPPGSDGGSPITYYTVTARAQGFPEVTVPVTSGTSAQLSGLRNGVLHNVTVAASNIAGAGPESSPVSVTPLTVPGAPTSVTAQPGSNAAEVAWAPPAGDGGSPVISYRVTARDPSGAVTATDTVPESSGTHHIVTGLANSVTYTVTVAATNAAGTGPESSPVSVTPQPSPGAPSAPRSVSASPGDTSATVAWDVPTNDGGSPIIGYTVSTSGSGTVPAPLWVDGLLTSAAITGLHNGTGYTFTVTAANAAGYTGPGSSSSATPHTVPGPPLNVIARPGNLSVDLTWNAPADDGGSPVTSYLVTVRDPGAAVTVAHTVLASTGTWDIVGRLANGLTYTVTVSATNAAGTGAESPAVSFTPQPSPGVPGAPRSVSASPGNSSATVTWDLPADDGGTPITGYTVKTNGAGTGSSTATWVKAPATSWSIGGLVNGQSYTFTVAALNASGTGPDSATSRSVTPATIPGRPTAVAGTRGDGSITVTWTAPIVDGGAAVESYTVTTRLLGAPISTVSVPAVATTVVVRGLVNGESYTVAVAAANAAGLGPFSAPAGPLTPVAPDPPAAARLRSGYSMLGSDGHVYQFGDARFYGDPRTLLGPAEAVDLETTASGNGYWVLDSLGRVYAYGDAIYFGRVAPATLPPGERVTTLSATPSGDGYWIFTNRGRALVFGAARFYGDVSSVRLNGAVIDSVPTADGQGYFMVAADGGIFAFGDANFAGSMGGTRLNAPVRSLVPDADGTGYWLVAADGGIFAFDAPFRGSMGGVRLNQPVTGMVRFGSGYLMVGSDGGLFNFSDRPFSGSLAETPPERPIVAVAVFAG